MRSKKEPQPSPARLYCSADRRPRCSKSISVRPSPRSVSWTITSSYTSSSGWSEMVKTSRSGSTTSRYVPFHWISCRLGPANIVARSAPPSVTSIETVETGTSASGPPNQSANRSGSVHSFQTRSRGTPKTRVIVIPASPATSGFRSVILGRLEACFEAVEAAFPERTILLEPSDGVLQRRRSQPRGPKLRRATTGDQPGLLQHLEVLGDRLDADRKGLGQLVDCGLTGHEPSQDRPACWVGEGREGTAELVGCHLYSGSHLIKRLIEYGTARQRRK